MIFAHMQSAVDAVSQSAHLTSKVAALIAGEDYAIARTNYWPPPIAAHFVPDARIGNASGTVHAETAALLAAPCTAGATMYLTDPPCPNCVKNMAEAGIAAIYIDHKGFEKDFMQRRRADFESLSLPICHHAGIGVYKVFRKEQRIETLLDIPPQLTSPRWGEESDRDSLPPPGRGLGWGGDFTENVQKAIEQSKTKPFALALAKDENSQMRVIHACEYAVVGYSDDEARAHSGKYSLFQQPLNRVLMGAAREGLKLEPDFIYVSRVPTAREWVDFIGAGFSTLHIGDPRSSRDEHGLQALAQLQSAGIITVKQIV